MSLEPKSEDFIPLRALVKRLVESQQKSATFEVAGFDPDKHDVLEALLERHKPKLDEALDQRHYLIKTPFRYPPLRHGSRFGSRHERGIFYASYTDACLFAEVAYYRFVFLEDMDVPLEDPIITEHSLFGVRVETTKAIALDEGRFDEDRETWRNTDNYGPCQRFGRLAREQGADIIRYFSARTNDGARNVAVLNHEAIVSDPKNMISVRCTLTKDIVHFLQPGSGKVFAYKRDDFVSNDVLPRPSD
ncbi:MAG: hypothetical protein C9356_11810 [Oleiphilus sp.]|nr:MAG: hypothetical protein C9356_11810 [Oleiphilus sp.]